jgi:DNA repair exonuclease SbcCD ATPase subunit
MYNLINVLIYNIDLRISQIQNKDNIKDDYYNNNNNNNKINSENNIHKFISYKQKLQALKTIVYTLSDIVSYSFYTSLNKLLLTPTIYTIDNIKNIFNEQLHKLLLLIEQLTKQFPEYEKQLKETQIIIQDKQRINKIENELNLLNKNINSLQSDFETNNTYDDIRHYILHSIYAM